MRNKNWIEFDKEQNSINNKEELNDSKNLSRINVYKQKKGKKGKTITLISGLNFTDEIHKKEFLKKIKIFCGTGGTVNAENLQLQGDMVEKAKEFIRNEGC